LPVPFLEGLGADLALHHHLGELAPLCLALEGHAAHGCKSRTRRTGDLATEGRDCSVGQASTGCSWTEPDAEGHEVASPAREQRTESSHGGVGGDQPLPLSE